MGKESACSAGDAGDPGLILGLGRSPAGWHGTPIQYSCLENPMERRVAKSKGERERYIQLSAEFQRIARIRRPSAMDKAKK